MDLSAKQDALLELGRSFGEKLATIKARRPDVSWYPYNSIANVGILSRFLPIEMLELMEDGGGRSVLDVGAADGDVAYFLESRGWKARAIDNPPTNNFQCKGIEALRDELSSAVRVDLMDVDRPFELERQYDLALALGILYHLRNPFAFLISLAMHAKRLILSTRVARQTKDGLNYSAVPGRLSIERRANAITIPRTSGFLRPPDWNDCSAAAVGASSPNLRRETQSIRIP